MAIDVVTLAASKKYTKLASLGLDGVQVNGTTIKFKLKDGSIQSMTFPQPADGISIINASIDSNNHLIIDMSNGTQVNAGLISTIKGDKGLKGDKGDKGDNGKSAFEIAQSNGFIGSENDWLDSLKGQDGTGGSGGDAKLEETITVAGVTVGNLANGKTLVQGMSVTDILKEMLVKQIAPTYTKPSVTINANPTFIEKGVTTTISLSSIFTKNDGGNATNTVITDGTTPTNSATATYSIKDNTQFKVTVNYGEGAIKNDNLGSPYPTGRIVAGSISATAKVNAYDPIFYGVGVFSQTNLGTKEVGAKPNSKTYAYNSNNDVCFIAVPNGMTVIKILDGNNFDNTNAFTKTTVPYTRQDGSTVNYNVYTSGVATRTNFKYIYTIA